MTDVVETDALNTLTVEGDPTIVLTEAATGPQGASGVMTTIVHDQSSASATWTINHNQGR